MRAQHPAPFHEECCLSLSQPTVPKALNVTPRTNKVSTIPCDHSTISLPRYIFIPQVNSYSPGLTGVTSIGTVLSCGRCARLPKSGSTTSSPQGVDSLRGAGRWYVKYIHMTPLDDPQLNYESKWASLTFEVK